MSARADDSQRACLSCAGGGAHVLGVQTTCGCRYEHCDSRQMSIVRRAALLVLLWSVSGCEASSNGPTADAVFQVRACADQTFNVRVTGSELVSRAQSLVGQAQQPIVTGRLARGSGGFNQPYSWHLLPESLEFADMTIEVCDGCPQMVEANLDYWVQTVGRFCPWTSRIVRRIR